MFKKIQKRDGTLEDFNINRFRVAIESAAEAVGHLIDVDKVASDAIAFLVSQSSNSDTTTVEDSLNAIETSLMKNNYLDIAKAFIIYRNRHSRSREQNSVFAKAIDDVSMDFEIRGNAAEWLWNVAHATSYCYMVYKILPQRISHYFTENYIWIHGLPYFGRTIRNCSFDLEQLFASEYFSSRGIKPPKRVPVLMNHLLQLNDAIHDDLGGEHVYHNFDVSMQNLIAALPQSPTKADIKQAAEYFVYSLNNSSITHTTSRVNSPCINIGLNTGENGNLFIKSMLESLIKMDYKNDTRRLPYIVYILKDEVNWEEGSPGYEIFKSCLLLAQKRGNVSFVWHASDTAQCFYSNGVATTPSIATNLQLTINMPKIALNSKGNFYDNLNSIVEVVEEMISMQNALLYGRTLENFPTLSKFPLNGVIYGGTDKFATVFQESNISIGITGLLEAVKILNPNISFMDMAGEADSILKKMKARIHLQNKHYKLMSMCDIKITNELFESDRQRSAMAQQSISGFSPGVTLLPIGYNLRDRIALEETLYDSFDMPVPVLIQRDKPREEMLDGLTSIKNKNAILTVI